MAVAAGAVNREPEKAGAGDLERVVKDAEEILRDHADVFLGEVASGAEIAGGDQGLADSRRPVGGFAPVVELVAGDLLGHEAVERLVAVERSDHIIAVAPLAFTRDDVGGVGVEADGIDVARHVEPVPAPASPKRGEARRRSTSRS